MTTIKEYKAMIEGATAAPWYVRPHKHDEWGIIKNSDGHIVASVRNPSVNYNDLSAFCKNDTDPYQKNSDFIATSRNIAPELIRVIELAEEAFLAVNDKSYFVPAVVQKALSEIRKLKGE